MYVLKVLTKSETKVKQYRRLLLSENWINVDHYTAERHSVAGSTALPQNQQRIITLHNLAFIFKKSSANNFPEDL